MKIAEDVRGHVQNIRYYSGEIKKLIKEQFDRDCKHDRVNTGPGTTRFDSLAIIFATAGELDLYCDNIISNLKTAEAQDKELVAVGDDKDGDEEN